jgi:hypothetical protein
LSPGSSTQIEELRAAGAADIEVVLYVLAHLHDGFLLGRRLADETQLSLAVMYLSQEAGRSVVPGVSLGSALRAELGPRQRGRISQYLASASSGPPQLVEIPRVPGQRHRVALIVRLASAASMVDDARHVATTGQVAHGPEHHTGYRLPPESTTGANGPCGAYLVIDTGDAYLPDDSALHAAVTTHIWECWQAARRQWAEQLADTTPGGGASVPPWPATDRCRVGLADGP